MCFGQGVAFSLACGTLLVAATALGGGHSPGPEPRQAKSIRHGFETLLTNAEITAKPNKSPCTSPGLSPSVSLAPCVAPRGCICKEPERATNPLRNRVVFMLESDLPYRRLACSRSAALLSSRICKHWNKSSKVLLYLYQHLPPPQSIRIAAIKACSVY